MAPHNIEAEEAVLGSLLIDPDAIFKVASFLSPEDFYREKNGWIYEAIRDLHNRREPADFVTLCDELERRGQLEEVGGAVYITSLINAVPTAIHVEYYARIVERTAILRRLIGAAGQIAAIAYEGAEDVDEVVDRAEQILFGVSQRRITRDLVPIKQIIGDYYDRIDYLYQHRGELIGIPTGFSLLDKLLGGLQRSDLIIVAGRPSMGKTSFVLSVAQNAARKFNQHVALFSLEMSAEQIVQRLISAETGIDSQRLRLGNLEDDEWPLFVQATGILSEAPIFIDDTPSISALQMRTKARRLHAEHGLDLIIVDFLQLMRGDGRAENRVQEISSISRALKGLARELNVPVVAVSQLSRAVEARHDHRPILSDLRESGCLTGDTLIQLTDGRRVPICQLAEDGGPVPVMALNETTWQLEPTMARKAWYTGSKLVFHLRTQLGHEIRATANHKFRTLTGWKRLDQLEQGEHIALPRSGESSLGRNPRLATSDIYWDRVAAIEPDGIEDVYDLEVPEHHNFVAGDIILHNSLEQDADVVMFIYREEMYNPDTELKNIADIIVAKHRNGPTGKVPLFFKKELAQFYEVELMRESL
jgi:replicative DNA helicase